ncbi:MAG: copper homeostasis protein CutC [Bacteroidota bacterium]
MKILEVACGNLASVVAASQGGADRIELCAALGAGGITPSFGFIDAARSITELPVYVMIRPREGDFLYDKAEIGSMVADVLMCRRSGVPGIVFGALTAEGEIDLEVCRRIMDAAGSMQVTFHRAFDLSKDPYASLEALCSLGVHRLLTSGQAPSAPLGSLLIKELVRVAKDRISIMAGAGVRPGNVEKLIKETGVNEIHLSGKQRVAGGMLFRRDHLAMGSDASQEYSLEITDKAQIHAIRAVIDRT